MRKRLHYPGAWFETHASRAPHHEDVVPGIKEDPLILRRPRSGRLEGRGAPIQAVDLPAFSGAGLIENE